MDRVVNHRLWFVIYTFFKVIGSVKFRKKELRKTGYLFHL
jgi:hypothetical protein